MDATVNERHPYRLCIVDSLSNTGLHYKGSICNVAYSVPPTQKSSRFDATNFIIKTIKKAVTHLRISSKGNLEILRYKNEIKKKILYLFLVMLQRNDE